MYEGCKCGSAGGGNALPDNPLDTTGLCCDKQTNLSAVGDQMRDFAWCWEMMSPSISPPWPPPPGPPPHAARSLLASTSKYTPGAAPGTASQKGVPAPIPSAADDAFMAPGPTVNAGNGTDVEGADEKFVKQSLGVDTISVSLKLHLKNIGENGGMHFSVHGRAVQVDPVKPKLTPPELSA